MPDLLEPFKGNAQRFAKHLSSLLTRTLPIDQPLACDVIYNRREERHNARIQLRQQTVKFKNGCSIRILHRVISNPEDHSKVMTAGYSYAYGFGELFKDGWLARYEYDPEQAIKDPDYEYSIAHVHFNGQSNGYNPDAIPKGKALQDLHFPTRRIALEDFIEHLIVELGVEPRGSKEAALGILAESRGGFKDRQTRHT